MHSEPKWPKLILSPERWVDAYAHGWAQLEAVIGADGWAMDGLAWMLYCARYGWRWWPIEIALDLLYTKFKPGTVAPPLAWLELELFRLTGHRNRLHRFLPLLAEATLPLSEAGELDPLARWVEALALTEIAKILDQPPIAPVRTTETVDLSPLWNDLCEPVARGSTTAAWIERALLWLALLRRQQDFDQHWHLAQIAAERCVAQPDLHHYLPPLLLDGVLGYLPACHEESLTWWLYADPPVGVAEYRLGSASLSLHATQESGQGTRISVQTSSPFTLEIVTAERTYIEFLTTGAHEMILTVLDRTDVR